MRGKETNSSYEARRMGDRPLSVGPLEKDGRWHCLCPACDEDQLSDEKRVQHEHQCTVKSLRGQHLTFNGRCCDAWETDAFESEEAEPKAKRFFYYSSIARRLLELSVSGLICRSA